MSMQRIETQYAVVLSGEADGRTGGRASGPGRQKERAEKLKTDYIFARIECIKIGLIESGKL